MDYQHARDYFLSKPESREDFPFYPDVAVFKVKGKMFATLSEEKGVVRCNLKCDPEQAEALRMLFDGVKPGYHMNKRHWNTVMFDGSVPDHEIERLIDHSYSLVFSKLKKSERHALTLLYSLEQLHGAMYDPDDASL